MSQVKISSITVKHVAKLAALPLTSKSTTIYQQQLASVMDYVSRIQQLDLSQTPETHQVSHLTNVFREDKVDLGRVLTPSQVLSNAHSTYDHYFMVPALIGER